MPLLDPDDIIIDGGNSLYTDTERRDKYVGEAGFRFIGAGVSGGEEGALKGPSIMPGGPRFDLGGDEANFRKHLRESRR